jgi:hypothetical protein
MVSVVDLVGYSASVLVALTFYMKEMAPLRMVALCSNVCFLAYGLSLHLGPVALLHATLIPINVVRLIQALACDEQGARIRGAFMLHRSKI